MLSRLKLITFDVTDTLLKFKILPAIQYGEIGAMYGIICDNKTLNIHFKENWYKMNREHPNFGLYSGLGWEKWWRNIVKGTFKDSNINVHDKQLDAVADRLIDIYKTSACWQYCHGTLNLLSYVRSKDIPMGVISNFDPRLNQILANVKLKHFFQFILTSYEVGVEKPDESIFQEAMYVSKIPNIKPDECLHIGNKPALDYYGAKSCGWHAVLIKDGNLEDIRKKYSDMNTDNLFKSLYELHKFFIETSNETLSEQIL